MDVVDGLLRIKRVRQDIREAEVRRAQHVLDQATQALHRANELQQERNRERTERERSLYQDVCSRLVVVRELNDLQFEVDSMKQASKEDEQAVADARAKRQDRRQGLDDATRAWAAAALAKQRFEDFAALEREAWARHLEWLAELELEEYPGRNALAEAMNEDPDQG